MSKADCHLSRTALTGPLSECGDAGVVVEDGSSCFVALVDVLGHGPDAAQVAEVARAHLAEHCGDGLSELLWGLHERLLGSRGAVAFAARLDMETGGLAYAGIGNICARLYGADDPVGLHSQEGVVGYMMPTPREKTVTMGYRDILLLTSDGVREHFELFEHPDLFLGSAQDIAPRVLNRLAKGDDDASCLVMRYVK